MADHPGSKIRDTIVATITWIGGHTGPNSWNNPLNWVGGIVPADGDDVVIDPAADEPSLNQTTNSLSSATVNAGASLTQTGFAFIARVVTNVGTIIGTDAIGDAVGLNMFSAGGTATNSGTIIGDVNGGGVTLHAGGSITNSASSVIQGGLEGVQSSGAVGTVTNAGTIEAIGPNGTGILFSDSHGVFDNTLTNTGTITGTSAAVRFGAGNDLLQLTPGASFTGLVDGGVGTNTLELSAGTSAGTLGGFGTSFTNFGTLAIDTGALWTVAGDGNGLSAATISGFTTLDTIDVTDLAFSSVSGVFASDTLVLVNAARQDTLHIRGNFASGNFRFSSDGSGGTNIQLVSAPASDPPADSLTSVPTAESDPQPDSAASLSTSVSAAEFDSDYYLAHNPDVAAAGVDPFTHYKTFGWLEGRDPNAFFNTQYYLNQNPDVAASGIDPLTHYQQHGWKEGRDPSSAFNTTAYLEANSDVAAAGIDPLAHYLQYGESEGRISFISTPHTVGWQDPLMDGNYYLSQYADVRAAGLDPFAHYDAAGWKEGRNPSALFDTQFYLQQNPDVVASGVDPLIDYEENGWLQGRDPSVQFSTSKYLAANPDVAAAGVNPLLHYEMYGQQEGRAMFHV